jgi:hypothetical protein
LYFHEQYNARFLLLKPVRVKHYPPLLKYFLIVNDLSFINKPSSQQAAGNLAFGSFSLIEAGFGKYDPERLKKTRRWFLE